MHASQWASPGPTGTMYPGSRPAVSWFGQEDRSRRQRRIHAAERTMPRCLPLVVGPQGEMAVHCTVYGLRTDIGFAPTLLTAQTDLDDCPRPARIMRACVLACARRRSSHQQQTTSNQGQIRNSNAHLAYTSPYSRDRRVAQTRSACRRLTTRLPRGSPTPALSPRPGLLPAVLLPRKQGEEGEP